jgi:hypothetical protein
MAKFGLSENERSALRVFASGLTALIGLDAESIGHIADYIGLFGTENAPEFADAVLMECMKVIIDAKARQG